MGDWLIHKEITHVAMESTGEYWKPVYNLLEGGFTVEEQIAVFDDQIASHIAQTVPTPPSEPKTPPSSTATCDPTSNLGADNPPLSWEKAITLLDTIPGVGQQTAELLLAEIGSDMSRFKSDAHLALVG